MLEFKHLLVAVGNLGQKNPPAVARAAGIAKRTGATVTLFHSLYSPYVAGEQFYSPDQLQKDIERAVVSRKRELEKLAKPLRDAGIPVHVRCRWDYPVHESIVREVMREGIDLVIVDSHRHAAAARLVLGNTDWQLIRLCPCPVLLAKTARAYDRPRILAAVDPMHSHSKPADLDELLLSTGQSFAEAFGGKLHAAHFYTLATPFTAGMLVEPVPMPVEVAQQHAKEVEAAFGRLTERYGLGPRRSHLRVGLPADELPELAEELDAHLVVMGAVSRSTLKRLFIGHTAERVIDGLKCDVLVVKPKGFKTPVPKRATTRPVVLPPI
ncbi:MAG: universal stress protein [Steroidobacteraceae bacterium]|jgi:universal stress protein E|nr:universal stress protein [Steroidobacteraceae bacterium]